METYALEILELTRLEDFLADVLSGRLAGGGRWVVDHSLGGNPCVGISLRGGVLTVGRDNGGGIIGA